MEHVTINGVGHFLQDGGAEQLVEAVLKFMGATPPAAIEALRAGPPGGEEAMAAKAAAEAAATERCARCPAPPASRDPFCPSQILRTTRSAVAHGDVGISTPSDGGKSFIAETPDGRKPYQ